MVEGTPLLREHAAYTRIEGSNPSVSASWIEALCLQGFFLFQIAHNNYRNVPLGA